MSGDEATAVLNVRIPADLRRALKVRAAEQDTTVQAIVIAAVRRELADASGRVGKKAKR